MKSILDNFNIDGVRIKLAAGSNNEARADGVEFEDEPMGTGPLIHPDITGDTGSNPIPDSINLTDEAEPDGVISDPGNEDIASSSLSQKPQSMEPAGRAWVQDILPALTSPIGLLGLLGRSAAPFVSDAYTALSNKANTGSRSVPTTTDTHSVEVNPVSPTAAYPPSSIDLTDPNKLPLRTAGASYIDNDGNERRYTWSQANIIPAGANGYQILSMMNNHRMISTPEYKARRQEYRDLVRSGDPAAIRAYEEELRAQFDAGTTLDFDQTREAQRRSWAQQEYQRQKQTQNNWAANNVATPYSRAYNRSQQRPAQPHPYQNAGYTPGAGNPTAQSTPQQSIYLNSAFSQFNPAGNISPATWSGDNPATMQDYANQFNTISTWAVDNGVDLSDMLDMRQNHQNMIRAGRMSHTDAINNMNSWAFYRQMQPMTRNNRVTTASDGSYYPNNTQVRFNTSTAPSRDYYNVHYGRVTNKDTQTPIKDFNKITTPEQQPGSFGYSSTGVLDDNLKTEPLPGPK